MWLHHHVHLKLLWLHDLAEVIHFHASELDWNQLLLQALAYELVIPLQETLPTIAQEWGAPIPEDVLEQCMALSVSPDEARAFAWHTKKGSSFRRAYPGAPYTPIRFFPATILSADQVAADPCFYADPV